MFCEWHVKLGAGGGLKKEEKGGDLTILNEFDVSLLLPNIQMASPLPDPTFPRKWEYQQPLSYSTVSASI
eukprot:scaffold8382_cov78-Skeletonema_dohrnii-CCMP3373.AAC.1